MRKFVAALVGAATLASAVPAVAAPLESRPVPDLQAVYPNEGYTQYYYRRGYYYPRPYYYRRYDNGAGLELLTRFKAHRAFLNTGHARAEAEGRRR